MIALLSFDDLCIQADQNMFNKVLHNSDHVFHCLLPCIFDTLHNYSCRPRAHDTACLIVLKTFNRL